MHVMELVLSFKHNLLALAPLRDNQPLHVVVA